MEGLRGLTKRVEDTAAMAQTLTLHFALGLCALDKQGLEQARGIVHWRDAHARAGPAHVRALRQSGGDRGEAGGAAAVFGSDLVQGDVLLGEALRFLLADAATQKSMHP